jgi:uncharacterized protein
MTMKPGKWMQTHTGQKFYPSHPNPDVIHYEDIANGLASRRRYSGQARLDKYYSVAEHCVILAEYAQCRKWSNNEVLAILLHDAAEAYLEDINPAVKSLLSPLYQDLEDMWLQVILKKYGAATAFKGMADPIKHLDRRIVANERRVVMNKQDIHWEAMDGFEPILGVVIRCWSAERAKQEWIDLFLRLRPSASLTEE